MSLYRFGTFEFDDSELRRDGTLVKLQAQPAQVLRILLENAGELVTRETLQQRVWADGTQVDFERGLNYCIAQVRSALGDSADSPRFVRTIPKKGYQFIAPAVEAVESPSPLDAPPPPTARRRWLPWIAVAAATVAIAAGGLWLSIAPQQPVIAICQFDNQTGDPEFDRVAAGFADNLTAELATSTALRVIGNADILRQQRTFQNLSAVQTQLGANYIVVGQVQKDSTGVRVLAHLLRMPSQTHVIVERLETKSFDNPLKTEADFARNAARNFQGAIRSSSPAVAKR